MVTAEAERELSRAFLLGAGHCLFARMKAAASGSVDLGREGTGSKQLTLPHGAGVL